MSPRVQCLCHSHNLENNNLIAFQVRRALRRIFFAGISNRRTSHSANRLLSCWERRSWGLAGMLVWRSWLAMFPLAMGSRALTPGLGPGLPRIRSSRASTLGRRAAAAGARNSESLCRAGCGNPDAGRSQGPSCLPGRCAGPARRVGRSAPARARGAYSRWYSHSSVEPRSDSLPRLSFPQKSRVRHRSSAPECRWARRNQFQGAAGTLSGSDGIGAR